MRKREVSVIAAFETSEAPGLVETAGEVSWMEKTGRAVPEIRLSGQVIIDQLVRNMELGRFEMGFSILVPCVFNIYLHPEDYARLSGILDLIREDARQSLSAKLAEWNARPFRLGVKREAKKSKVFKIASKDFNLEFVADSEATVPLGDVEIHSELNETPQPGYHGVKTTLLDREPSVNEASQQGGVTGVVAPPPFEPRRAAEKLLAEIRYEDDSGPQLYNMTQDEIAVGRGGDDVPVQIALYTNDEVSREHLRIRRDSKGRFIVTDRSRNGTWIDGKRLNRGVEEKLPDKAEIGVAEVLTLHFEAKR